MAEQDLQSAWPALGTSWATLDLARSLTPRPGQRSVDLFRHGSMQVKYYAPRGQDLQTPHTQDEIYVVAQGSGWFVNGDARHPFGPGDVLFVAAGVVHRFEEFGDDFGAWVVFYGPEGGER